MPKIDMKLFLSPLHFDFCQIIDLLCFKMKRISGLINPYETSRRVFFWSCGTHSLKAMRNNLYRSQPNMARNLRKSDVHFGWKDIETILLRDEARTTN